jgi:DNA repair photolyase
MSLEKKFEKEKLQIEKERVLIYSKLKCPFNCKYCFSEHITSGQEKNVSYLSEKQLNLLQKLPEKIKLIMLGCDTEFFQSKQDSLKTLEKLSNLGKDISVITKLFLPQDFIEKLKEINIKLNQRGNSFTFSESIACLNSAEEWEPKASRPQQRIETLKIAHAAGIKTLVAIRPLLPILSNQELETIVNLTKDYCNGYYSGPLYLKNLDHPIIKNVDSQDLIIENTQPPWMPKGNIFYKIEKRGQMEFLKTIINKNDKPFFEGAADAIQHLKTNEKY